MLCQLANDRLKCILFCKFWLVVLTALSFWYFCCTVCFPSSLLVFNTCAAHFCSHAHSTSLLRSAWQKSRKNWNRTTLPSKQMQFQSWPMWVRTIFSWFSIPSFKSILGDGWFQHLAFPWEPTSSGLFQVLPKCCNAISQNYCKQGNPTSWFLGDLLFSILVICLQIHLLTNWNCT